MLSSYRRLVPSAIGKGRSWGGCRDWDLLSALKRAWTNLLPKSSLPVPSKAWSSIPLRCVLPLPAGWGCLRRIPRHPRREVEGAVDMMLDATQKSSEPLTVDRLARLAGLPSFPAGRSGLHHVLTGRWRTPEMDPMQVVSGPIREPVRRKNIHFEAPAAKRIPGEVDAFLRWFEGKDAGDWILRAALAHLWFVTLHPFADGNGRLSRAIADLALARADGAELRFYSMSAQIEAEKKQYYAVLESTQKGCLDVTPLADVVPRLPGPCAGAR